MVPAVCPRLEINLWAPMRLRKRSFEHFSDMFRVQYNIQITTLVISACCHAGVQAIYIVCVRIQRPEAYF